MDSVRQLAEQVNEAFNKLENGKSEFVSHDDARLDMEARKTKIRNRTTNGRQGKSLPDAREVIFKFLREFNLLAAEQTDTIIETKVENLIHHPMMGVEREGISGRLLIIPEVSMIVSYFVNCDGIQILRVLHRKQKFPAGN